MNKEQAIFPYVGAALQRRRLPAVCTFVSVLVGAILYLSLAPRFYKTTARLMLNGDASVSELGRDLAQSPNSGREASPLADQAELIKSRQVLERAIETVSSNSSREAEKPSLGELRENLSVNIVPATNILELSYENQVPELAAKLLNAVARSLVEKSTESNRSEARALREFLEAEVANQRVEVTQAETEENAYRRNNRLVSLEEQTENLVEDISDIENQEQSLLAQIKEKSSQVQELRQTTNIDDSQTAYLGGRVGQDEELQELRAKLAELETELASARSRLTDENPTVVTLLEERNELLALYDQSLARFVPANQPLTPNSIASDDLSQALVSELVTAQIDLLAFQDKLETVQTQREKLEARLALLPGKAQPLTELVRQREEANESLQFLQRKLEEARIAEAQLLSELDIVELAEVPYSPSSPNSQAVLVVAAFAGLILAFGVVLLLEVLDNTLQNASEVEQQLQLPILGVQPYLPATAVSLEQSEQFLNDPRLVEPYRLFLKALESSFQNHLDLVVVSSTIAGEGKSVVASHLAAVSALLSRRTLIIDADLRRPKQHSFFGVNSQPGLTDVVNNNLSLLETLQPTGIDNLSVLTSGQLTSHSYTVLESASMQSVLNEAKSHFDLVVIDTPPVSSCADAHTLSRWSDGLVIVTRPNYTPKDVLMRAVTELKRNGAPIAGVVINGMTAQTEKYYRYAYDGYQPLPRRRLSSSDRDGRDS